MRFPRTAGCLLHPTSLPGPHGSGDLGADAYRFVDWLAAAGLGVWQVLPLGETGRGHSPYMSPSAFAGNPLLIDLVTLRDEGWLDGDDLDAAPAGDGRTIDFARVARYRGEWLAAAAARFRDRADAAQREDFERFCAQHADWLDDYALFRALADCFPQRDWCDWERPLAARESSALDAARQRLASEVSAGKFYQWCFHRQWHRLRDYANARGVRIFGDAPIFVAYQSADVWARPELFDLRDDGRMRVVAGVPPDYFSATGQLWGNPLYRWERHRQEDFAWWTRRIRHSLELCDLLRIDHFLGFVNYWEIDADAETAVDGHWLPGPGAELFEHLEACLGELPIVAENLGTVTTAVEALRERFGFPGMAVLQFAFSGDAGNPHLPQNQVENQVVYSGTHDNDTTLGWWFKLDDTMRRQVCETLGSDGREPHFDLIHSAFASPAHSAVIPLQDYLGLDGTHRLNRPGVAEGNWGWRFRWSDVAADLAPRIAQLGAAHGRAIALEPR
jgi:4-alpha-glucanotransferase